MKKRNKESALYRCLSENIYVIECVIFPHEDGLNEFVRKAERRSQNRPLLPHELSELLLGERGWKRQSNAFYASPFPLTFSYFLVMPFFYRLLLQAGQIFMSHVIDGHGHTTTSALCLLQRIESTKLQRLGHSLRLSGKLKKTID